MKTAVIIGAGPAGLTAAYEFVRKGGDAWRVVVLEESDQIGGISRTAVHNGCRIDIGGHRFFSKSKEVNDLWHELIPTQGAPSKDDRLLGRTCHVEPGGPDPEADDVVMLRRRRVSRIYYNRMFPKRQDALKVAWSVAAGVFIGIWPTIGVAILLTTAIIWGISFVAQVLGGDNLPPFGFNALRFFLGSLSLLLLCLL